VSTPLCTAALTAASGERHQYVLDTEAGHPVCLEELGCLVSGGSEVRKPQQERQLKLASNGRQCGPPPLRA